MEPINVQFSITGWETDDTPREQIGLHQTLAIYGFRDLLEFACDNYTQSGRGVVIMRYSDLVDYNPNASTEFDVKVGYVNPVDLGFLPDPVSSKITAMITAYDVERTFVFVVLSERGVSTYTFGCPSLWLTDSHATS
jgi:hypothetical protein